MLHKFPRGHSDGTSPHQHQLGSATAPSRNPASRVAALTSGPAEGGKGGIGPAWLPNRAQPDG
eukprot:4150056-Pyramimonas_sp.AAC.1